MGVAKSSQDRGLIDGADNGRDHRAWKAVLEEQAKKPEVSQDEDLRNAVNDLLERLGETDLGAAGTKVEVTLRDQATGQGIIGAGKVEIGEMSFGKTKKD